MTDSPGDVLNLIRDNEVQIVDLRFADLPGLMQHFSVPAHELSEDAFEDGWYSVSLDHTIWFHRPFRMDEWGVDLAITGSQKGLMLPPGLSFNAVSTRALPVAAPCGSTTIV